MLETSLLWYARSSLSLTAQDDQHVYHERANLFLPQARTVKIASYLSLHKTAPTTPPWWSKKFLGRSIDVNKHTASLQTSSRKGQSIPHDRFQSNSSTTNRHHDFRADVRTSTARERGWRMDGS